MRSEVLRRAYAAAVLAPLLAWAAQAGAQTTTDVVTAEPGGELRGTIVELEPGDHLTIRTAGADKRLSWSAIRRIDRDVPAAPPPPTAPLSPTGSAPAAQSMPPRSVQIKPPDRVTLQFEAPSGVELQSRRDDGDEWTVVCNGACTQKAPHDSEYRVVGDGMYPSRDFKLNAPADSSVALKVSPGWRAAHTWGVVLLVGGGAATILGFAESNSASSSGAGFSGAPLAFLVGGLAGVGIGIGLVASNGSTTVMQRVDEGPTTGLRIDPQRAVLTPSAVPGLVGSF
jgi:hypothetical protein